MDDAEARAAMAALGNEALLLVRVPIVHQTIKDIAIFSQQTGMTPVYHHTLPVELTADPGTHFEIRVYQVRDTAGRA